MNRITYYNNVTDGEKLVMYRSALFQQQKPILPPPPSSRDRSSRNPDASSAHQTKTPHSATSVAASDDTSFHRTVFNFSHDFNTSGENTSSSDWFTPPPTIEIQKSAVPTAADQHEAIKQEILSQFDVFTELDPLGLSLIHVCLFVLFRYEKMQPAFLFSVGFHNFSDNKNRRNYFINDTQRF